jgi:PAS domain S-box-containing protein
MGIDITERKQAEEKLRLLNAYNRSLIEANLDALATITPDGKIGDVNSVTEAITGFSREELIGTDFSSYFTDPEKARAGYQQVFEIGSVRDYELEIQHKDGYTTPVIYNASIYRDEASQMTGVFAAARDITERKQAERHLILLTTALESAANGIILTDINGSILWSNPAFSQMTGFAHEEIIGQNPRLIKSGKQEPTYYQELWNTILAGEVWHGELINRRKDGSLYYEEQTITPVIDQKKNITNFISIKQDITDHKRAEQLLERQNQELLALSKAEHRQRELAESLVESVKALSSSLRLEDVLSTILDQIRRTVPFRGADIILIEGQTFHVAGFRGFEDLPDSVAAMHRTYVLEDFPLFQCMCTTLQPVLVPNTLEEPDWRVAAGMEWVRSYLAVPLIRAGQIIGILNMTSDQLGFFSQETVERLKAFADHAALALHNARIYKAELTARQVAETLRAAAQALTQTLDLDKIIDILLEHIEAIIHSDTSGIALLEGEKRLAVRGVRGDEHWIDADQALSIVLDIDSNPLLEEMFSAHKSILIPNTATNPSWQVLPGLEPIHSWLGVPLIASDRVIGVIGMGKSEKKSFTLEQIQWAEALVGQAAIAIQNAWLFEQVRYNSERLQSLARKLVDIQESERYAIARELHDEAGQMLSSMKLSLRQLEQDPDCPTHVRQRLQELKDVADNVLEELHRLAMDLRPVTLDRLGLVAALEQLTHSMSTDWLSIRFKAVGFSGERLPKDLETALYRIVQEAITNVVRHAQASTVGILLESVDDKLKVFVEDDGIGFDADRVNEQDRLGVVGMRERAEMFGGALSIESAPGKGTTIIVEVPIGHSNPYRG